MLYAAQVILQIDAEIAKKGHLWMETNYLTAGRLVCFADIFIAGPIVIEYS